MKVTRTDFLELAVHNVFNQQGHGISYRAGIKKAMRDLKLTSGKARELFDKGSVEIG